MQNPTPVDPLIGPPNRRFSVSRPARFAFWLLAVATLSNWNHLANLTVGRGTYVNLGLALCCAFLFLVVRLPLRRVLGIPGFLIVAALISYLFIGLSVALLTDFAWYAMNHPTLPFHVGLAVLIIVTAALGASALLRQIGVERLLKGILAILAVICTLILATPLLVDFYMPPAYLSDVMDIAPNRFTGTYINPNMAGMVACYAAGLALAFLNAGRYRTFAVLVMILSSAACLLTYSRTVFFTWALLLLLFLYFSTFNLYRKGTFLGVTLAMAFGAVFFLSISNVERFLALTPDQFNRLMSMKTLDFSGNYAPNVRWGLWDLGWSRITESPLFGHGLMRFHHLEGAGVCQFGFTCGVHNTYLMLWGEAGLIPPSLFLLFLSSLLWKRLTLPRSLAMDAAVVLIFVFAMASMSTDGTVYFFWHAFILGLSCAMAAHATRESRGWRSGQTLETRPAGLRRQASARTKSLGTAPSATG